MAFLVSKTSPLGTEPATFNNDRWLLGNRLMLLSVSVGEIWTLKRGLFQWMPLLRSMGRLRVSFYRDLLFSGKLLIALLNVLWDTNKTCAYQNYKFQS